MPQILLNMAQISQERISFTELMTAAGCFAEDDIKTEASATIINIARSIPKDNKNEWPPNISKYSREEIDNLVGYNDTLLIIENCEEKPKIFKVICNTSSKDNEKAIELLEAFFCDLIIKYF